MRIDIMTLFPESVDAMLNVSILGRAQERGHIAIRTHQIRAYTTNKQMQVDDYPYGGGRGAVMQADPLYRCHADIVEKYGAGRTIYLSPCGRVFTQAVARELKERYDHLILVCGHYEGVDQRFLDECVDEEISMGDFVVTGGEIPAMALTDAVCRMVPGVLPEEECFTEESHWDGLLEYPQYSRPDEWHGRRVPEVLLSGHHENVAKWRRKESWVRTMLRRPDLWERFDESSLTTRQEKKLLAEAKEEAAARKKRNEETHMKHSVELTSVGNARELGGYAVGERTVRSGLLLRTGSLSEITPADRERLETVYRVSDVIDFRMRVERSLQPDPALTGAENRSLAVMEPEDYGDFDDEMMAKFLDPRGDRMAVMRQSMELGMLDDTLYVKFLTSERGKAAYRGFFRTLLELPEGRAVLWHCTDGKDRTGVASMLLLTALGASWETVMEDYLLTNDYNAKKIAGARAMLEQASMPPEVRDMLIFGVGSVFPAYMNNARKALADAWGSVEGYLEQELGVGEREREILREKFLSPLRGNREI